MSDDVFYPGAWPKFQAVADPNVPASDPSQIPEIFEDFLSVLWPRAVYTFTNPTDRDTQLPRTPGVSVFAFTRDTGTLWVSNNGGAWQAIATAGGAPRASQSIGWYCTSVANGENPITINNGSVVSRMSKVGREVAHSWVVSRGTTTTVGDGNYSWSYPVAPRDYRAFTGSGFITISNVSVPVIAVPITGSRFRLMRTDTGAIISNTTTVGSAGWDAGDVISFTVEFEAAS